MSTRRLARLVLSTLLTALWFLVPTPPAVAGDQVKVDGYAEYRLSGMLVVDGQRIAAPRDLRVRGSAARSFDAIPLGAEVKVEGRRQRDGSILADKVEAKPNGNALFETELTSSFDEMEKEYVRRGRMFEAGSDGQEVELGRLYDDGAEVRRVRKITQRLVPPYLEPEQFRVYVIDNDEWNAMAAPNRSIYVFSGLLDDMNDDEVAIILGHELAHATHEHSRRGFKKQLFLQMAALGGAALAGEAIDDDTKASLVQVGLMIGATAWSNGYGRQYEDQADRVGLRYAYEGGYDVNRGPALWQRFEDKYGAKNKTVNFFFGSHSVAADRARNLRAEIDYNYRR